MGGPATGMSGLWGAGVAWICGWGSVREGSGKPAQRGESGVRWPVGPSRTPGGVCEVSPMQGVEREGNVLHEVRVGAAERGRVNIKTAFVYPPIPLRTHDWCAWVDGEEEDGFYGWGETEQEAIDNLWEHLEEA